MVDNIRLADLNSLTVQSETMYQLEYDDLRSVLGGAQFEGEKIKNIDAILNSRNKFPDIDFKVAVVRYNVIGWLAYLVHEIDGDNFRGTIQLSECPNCRWKGYAFAPVPDYFNDPEDIAKQKLRLALEKSSKNCPNCNAEIPKQPAFFRFQASS